MRCVPTPFPLSPPRQQLHTVVRGILALARQMPVLAVALLVGGMNLWLLIDHWVTDARQRRNGSAEPSSKRGHNYISAFVNLAHCCMLFTTPGKDTVTVTGVLRWFTPPQVSNVNNGGLMNVSFHTIDNPAAAGRAWPQGFFIQVSGNLTAPGMLVFFADWTAACPEPV